MTTVQVVETSVTNNSLSEDYSHPANNTRQATDTLGINPFANYKPRFQEILHNLTEEITAWLTYIYTGYIISCQVLVCPFLTTLKLFLILC